MRETQKKVIWEHEKTIKEFSSGMMGTQGSLWEVTDDDHRAWASCEGKENNCRILAKKGTQGFVPFDS